MEDKDQLAYDASSPQLVPRSNIPISSAPEHVGLEVRPFVAHDVLGSMIPHSAALAWTHARPGQDVPLRSHPIPGLLIVLQGNAQLTGQIRKSIEQGDVITLPSHHQYGFARVGEDGLHALHVAFSDNGESPDGDALSLEQLLAVNDRHAQAALQGPFFRLLNDGALDNNRKRATLRQGIRVFSDAFQTILFTRRATCRDDHYQAIFDAHFLDEMGHNKLLNVENNSLLTEDPILKATANWFCHQMLVLDNAGKAALHVVLETAGDQFHTLASPVFSDDPSAKYFATHASVDAEHTRMGIGLLEGHHPETYRRLSRVVDDCWQMFDTMTRRIAFLVELSCSTA